MSNQLAELEYKRIMESGQLDKSLFDSFWFKRKFIELYKDLAGYTNTQIYKNDVIVEIDVLGNLSLTSIKTFPDEKSQLSVKNIPYGSRGSLKYEDQVETEGLGMTTQISFKVQNDGYLCINRSQTTNYYVPKLNINYISNSIKRSTWKNGEEIAQMQLIFPTFILNSHRLETPFINGGDPISDYIPRMGDIAFEPHIYGGGAYAMMVSSRYQTPSDNIICISYKERSYGDKTEYEYKDEVRYVPNGTEYPNEIRPTAELIAMQVRSQGQLIRNFVNPEFSSFESAIDWYRNPNYIIDKKSKK